MANEWYNDALKLRDFAQAMLDAGVVEDTNEVYKKPYRFNDQYDVWEQADFPDSEDPNWDEFVSSLNEEDTETEG